MTALTNSQTSSEVSDPYHSAHDSAELQRMGAVIGIGETVFDDQSDPEGEQIANLLEDFGYMAVDNGEMSGVTNDRTGPGSF